MSKTVKIKLSNDDHRWLQQVSTELNKKIREQEGGESPDSARWEPENLAKFLITKSMDLIDTDPGMIPRFFLSGGLLDY